MAVKDRPGATVIPLTQDEQDSFAAGVSLVKGTMKKYGFSQEALDTLNFGIGKYTLTISQEEGRNGAFHTQADGKPFYTINVATPGSMYDIKEGDPATMPAKSQAALLAFEVGINLFMSVEKVLELNYGMKADERNGGAGMPVSKIDIETTTRRDPFLFFMALNDLVDMRLNMIAPKAAAAPAAPKTKPAAGLTP